jgi:hypothetical protein
MAIGQLIDREIGPGTVQRACDRRSMVWRDDPCGDRSRNQTPASRGFAAHHRALRSLAGSFTGCPPNDGRLLIAGEAGIGKSRLTAALIERLGGEPHTRLRYFCSQQHTDSALYPIIGQMERAAGMASPL